jgi:putative tricarboxylic transport membrane protein
VVKLAASALFLALALVYLWLGFDYSMYTPDGRIGAGFFPRVVGVALVAVTGLNLLNDIRSRKPDESSAYWRDLFTFMGLMILFVIGLMTVGAIIAMVLFIFAVLTLYNRGRWVTNVSVSIGLPLGIYLLFVVWLNASLPRGALDLL